MKKTKPKKVAKALAPANNTGLNVNLDYVLEITDEAIATVMALRGLVQMLVAEREDRDAR